MACSTDPPPCRDHNVFVIVQPPIPVSDMVRNERCDLWAEKYHVKHVGIIYRELERCT